MRRMISPLAILACLVAPQVFAEERPAVPLRIPTAEEICAHPPEAKLPELEWKFEMSEAKEEVYLEPEQVGQPEVMELRYIAKVVLGNPDMKWPAPCEGDASKLTPWKAYSDLSPRRGAPTPQELREALVQGISVERLPSPAIQGLLAAGRPFFLWVDANPFTRGSEIPAVEFWVTSPTSDQAKERAQGIAKMFAEGFFYRHQQEAARQIGVRCSRVREIGEEIAGLKKKLLELAESRKGSEDLDLEALRTLKMQQRLLGVDIAGTMAKLEACNKVLQPEAGKTVPPARTDQVESLKVTAEIELVGLIARKRALAELVAAAETQATWLAEKEKLQLASRKLEANRKSLEQEIVSYWVAFQINQARLVEPIRIAPIQWKPVTEAETWGPPPHTQGGLGPH